MKLSDRFVFRSVAGERLLVQTSSDCGRERIVYLNETAADILELLLKGHSVDAVAERLLDVYEADGAQLVQDVGETLRTFIQAGILIDDCTEEGA